MIERNCFDFCCFPVMEERNKKTEAQLREFQIGERIIAGRERQLCVCAGYSGYLCKNTGEGRSDQRWICCDK